MNRNGYVNGIDLRKLLRGEYEPQHTNIGGRISDFGYNILNKKGLLYEPIVDKYHPDMQNWEPEWPDGADFAVCLTHDVDRVSMYSTRQATRTIKHHFRGSNSFSEYIKGLAKCGSHVMGTVRKSHDPVHCYERWLEAEDQVGGKSTFFFPPDHTRKPHRTDPVYTYSDTVVFDGKRCTVAEMIREIDDRGWEIGLHPTWNTYNDPKELKYQKEQLEGVVGHEIVSVRQHYLNYDIAETPRVHANAGFKFDSTLGFNDNIGFRFGTSYPWNLYDIEQEEELPIMEMPLIIQDGALLNKHGGLRLDEDTAFEYITQISKSVKNVGGVLTLLWHPAYIRLEDWWNLYLRTLDWLDDQNAWFGSIKEIGEWWSFENYQ